MNHLRTGVWSNQKLVVNIRWLKMKDLFLILCIWRNEVKKNNKKQQPMVSLKKKKKEEQGEEIQPTSPPPGQFHSMCLVCHQQCAHCVKLYHTVWPVKDISLCQYVFLVCHQQCAHCVKPQHAAIYDGSTLCQSLTMSCERSIGSRNCDCAAQLSKKH